MLPKRDTGGSGKPSWALLSPLQSLTRSMDMSKVVLFLLLFNLPGSDKGGGVVHLASGTLISISTAKGSVIISADGQQPINPVINSGANPTQRRWNHYETALSNTGPLADEKTSTTTTTTSTTSVPPTTSYPDEVEPSSVLDSQEVTRKPLSSLKQVNKTSHVTFDNKNLLNNARKYIASYEDLQSRFPDGSPFENNTSVNMTVPLGDTAFLRCRVRNLGERSISWIRRRDWHIISNGKITFSNDERFHILHSDGSEDWVLQIKFVQKRDNGSFECQVSTGTGIISYFVNLFVAVPEAFILGNGEYHVEQGSNINLVCVIEKSPKAPEFIFWYHNERMINYGNSREVIVRTEPGARTHSKLNIKNARISDSGNYTCKTAHAEPASIFVYVSEASGLFSGDKMAAIQRRKTGSTSSTPDETAPIASSSATTLTTQITTALAISLVLYSSIQLSSSLEEKVRGTISWGNKVSHLREKFLRVMGAIIEVVVTMVQLLLSLFPWFITGGREILYVIKVSLSRLWLGPQAKDIIAYHTHHYHPHCSSANSLRNSEQQHHHLMQREKRVWLWSLLQQQTTHFVILVKRVRLLYPDPVSS